MIETRKTEPSRTDAQKSQSNMKPVASEDTRKVLYVNVQVKNKKGDVVGVTRIGMISEAVCI
jgi:hypothetical protein